MKFVARRQKKHEHTHALARSRPGGWKGHSELFNQKTALLHAFVNIFIFAF